MRLCVWPATAVLLDPPTITMPGAEAEGTRRQSAPGVLTDLRPLKFRGLAAERWALMASERGGPKLCYQFLICPIIERDFTTTSYRDNAEGYGLMRADLGVRMGTRRALRCRRARSLRCAIVCEDLAGLVVTAGYDVLRDEGEAYAHRLQEVGVKVALTQYPTLVHGFFGTVSVVDAARRALQATRAALSSAFTNSSEANTLFAPHARVDS